MTDAREIIAEYLRGARYFSPTTEDNSALEIIHALHAAGSRILGKDEVDPATVEKCATELETNWGHICTPEMRDAIRTIGRKA